MGNPSPLDALDYLALLAELKPERFPYAAIRDPLARTARTRSHDADARRVAVSSRRSCSSGCRRVPSRSHDAQLYIAIQRRSMNG
jgi:hypothetical protein